MRLLVAVALMTLLGLGVAFYLHASAGDERPAVSGGQAADPVDRPAPATQPDDPRPIRKPAARKPAAPGTIFGEVTDPQEQPLAEARIESYPVTPDSFDEEWRREHTVVVYTNADGSFAIDDQPAGRYFVTATAPGYCGAGDSRLTCETGDRLVFQLVRCSGVSGQVFGSDGYPLGNVTLKLTVAKTPPGSPIARGSYQTTATTNSGGRYTFESVPFGKIELEATHKIAGKKTLKLHLAEGEHLRGADLTYE